MDGSHIRFVAWVLAGAALVLGCALSAGAQDGDVYGTVVGEIRIEGLNRTREYIVTRELETKVGEPCLRENLEGDARRLENLDIFADVKIAPIVEDDRTVVVFELVESLALLPSVSLQLSDENGVSAGGGLKVPNFLGKDIFVSARALFGGATMVEARIHNPWAFGYRWAYLFDYALRERTNKIADFEETANEFDLWIQGNWGERGRIGGQLQFLQIKSDRDDVTLDPSNTDKVSRIGLVLGWDSRDAFVDTRRGWKNEVVLSRAIELFPNAARYTQIDIDLRRYQSLPFWDRHTLGLFSLTTLRTGAVGEQVPLWQLFGIGGTNTVRGWEFAARTGKNQFINTIVYRATVMEPRPLALPFGIKYRLGIQLAAFGDLGIGWDERNEFATQHFIGGAGFGIRFLIPIIGELRCDLGIGGGSARLHFGAPEKPEMARRRVR